jgi:iron complex outermembrane receptor protein
LKSFAPSTPLGARRVVVAGAVVSVLVGGGWAGTAHAQDGTRTFDIPAQDARRALVDLCE